MKEYFEKFLIPIIVFLVLYVIDFILGLCKGIFYEGVSSSKLRLSIPKFVGYIGMIISTIAIDVLFMYYTDVEWSPIALISVISICIIEFKSIIENLKSLGVYIPNKLKEIGDKNDI